MLSLTDKYLFGRLLNNRIKHKWFHVDGKYRGIVLHSERYSIDWLATETSRVEQGCCEPQLPILYSTSLLNKFMKMVLTFKKFPGEALVGRCP